MFPETKSRENKTNWLPEASCLCCCVYSQKRKLAGPGGVFPAFFHATFQHAFITCSNVARAGYIA